MTAMKVKEEGKAHGQKQSDSGEEMAVYVLMGDEIFTTPRDFTDLFVLI